MGKGPKYTKNELKESCKNRQQADGNENQSVSETEQSNDSQTTVDPIEPPLEDNRDVLLVTSGNNAPFTDEELLEGGDVYRNGKNCI